MTPPKGTCTRPPKGWWCSLPEGHDNMACPTRPTLTTRLRYWLHGLRL